MTTVTRVVSGFNLLESPRWIGGRGLVFSDMKDGGVYSLSDSGAVHPLVPHRKAVGGIVPHADGGLVVTGRNVCLKAVEDESGGPTAVLLETGEGEEFFNDATADPSGRVYVGSVPSNRPETFDPKVTGRLYRIDLDGHVEVLADDIGLSNGIVTSTDGRHLFHVDSLVGVIASYRIDLATPEAVAASRQTFVDTSEYGGVPDGLAVAADGSVWVAIALTGTVVGYDEAGNRVAEIAMPQPLVTAPCFGGDSLRTLFVATGGSAGDQDSRGGCVYSLEVDRSGVGCNQARVLRCPPSPS